MNSSNAHLYLPLVQALADGKTIQLKGAGWNDCKDTDFKWSPDLYRVKPATFPPLPDGCTWHNPDNLTPEQVGDGYRLIIDSEFGEIGRGEVSLVEGREGDGWLDNDGLGFWAVGRRTYRVPISTPFPDGSYIKDGKLVKPEPQKPVPLGPEDIWPGDAIRQNDEDPGWAIIVSVGYDGVDLCGIPTAKFYSFQKLCDGGYQILHRGQSTWFPCHKLP